MPADRAHERGSAAVEFALLLPILLLLLLALVQVGVIARDSLVLTQASRAGAREAAVQGRAMRSRTRSGPPPSVWIPHASTWTRRGAEPVVRR